MNSPPILEPILVGIGMFTGGTGYGLLTHGHEVPWLVFGLPLGCCVPGSRILDENDSCSGNHDHRPDQLLAQVTGQASLQLAIRVALDAREALILCAPHAA